MELEIGGRLLVNAFHFFPFWSTVSGSGLPTSRKMRSYWRESRGGLRG